MKITFSLVFIFFLGLISTSMNSVNSDYTFSDYVRQFNKQYSDGEYAKRQLIFNTNFQKLKEKIEDKGVNYNVEVNKFTDWSEEEKSSYSTYRPAGLKQTFTPKPPLILRAAQLPPIDYRALGMVTQVKDQGSCGSCWAFSSTALYESKLIILGQITNSTDLSEQFVLRCTNAGSCDGGVPQNALNQINKTGIPLQSNYPYTATYTASNYCVNSNYTFKKLSKSIKSINHYFSLTDAELQQLLTDNGPIAVAVSAGNSAFMDYSSGIFTGCPSGAQVDHAVLLVGFTAQGHWIVKNSWGTDWGDQGYITIHKNYDCGLKTYVDVVVVQTSASTPSNSTTNTTTTNTTTTNTTNTTNITGNVTYKVNLTDSFGDGWNGNILGIIQQGKIVAVFGTYFTQGSFYGPVDLVLKKGIPASIVVYVYGSYTEQIGFKLYDDTSKLIYTRTPTAFTSLIIFFTFCPYCTLPETAQIFITLNDLYGDGMNGNQLAIKSTLDQSLYPFGANFINGYTYPQIIRIRLKTNVLHSIIPYVIGTYRYQIGFVIRNEYGTKLFERVPGSNYGATDVLGTICLLCQNNLQVLMATLSQDQKASYTAKQQLIGSNDNKQASLENSVLQKEEPPRSTITVIVILSVVLIILLVLWSVTLIALYKIWKRAKYSSQHETDRSNSIHFTLNQNKSTVIKTEIDKSIKQDAN